MSACALHDIKHFLRLRGLLNEPKDNDGTEYTIGEVIEDLIDEAEAPESMSGPLKKIEAPDDFDQDHYEHKGTIKFEKCAGDWSGTSDSGLMKRREQLGLLIALRAEINGGGLRAGFYDAGRVLLRVYWATSNECAVDMYSAHNWPACYSKR